MNEDIHDRVCLEYRRTKDDLRAQLSAGTRNDRDLVEDILQETWWRAVRTWRQRGVPDRPAAWLATVARNVLRNEYRRRRAVRLDGVQDVLVDDSYLANPSASLEFTERNAEVHRALGTLSQPETELLSGFYFKHMSVAALAARLGVSERAVEGRLRRARKKLRAQLDIDRLALLGLLAPRNRKAPVLGGIALSSLVPFLPILALAPLAFFVGRLNRERLATIRVAAGLLLVLVSLAFRDEAARPTYALLMTIGGLAVSIWGGRTLMRARAITE